MFKPLLASAADVKSLVYPLLATPKIDGIRCLVTEEGPLSRKLKPIPNLHIQSMLNDAGLVGLDGELLTFTNGVRDDFNTVQSKVMSRDGEPDFKFIVFDRFDIPEEPYFRRVQLIDTQGHSTLEVLHPVEINNQDELDQYEAECVDKLGWEGVMLRRPFSPYKYGRSTAKEGILLKLKRFVDTEATIIGVVEQYENTNEAKINALGLTERSSAKAGKVAKGTLGALRCSWEHGEFEIGTGFTQAQRDALWAERGSLIGKKVTFKYQGLGSNGAPRFPVFLGIRRDL